MTKSVRSAGEAAWGDFMKFLGARENVGWVFRGVGDKGYGLRPRVGRDDNESFRSLLGFSEVEDLRIFSSFKRSAAFFAVSNAVAERDAAVYAVRVEDRLIITEEELKSGPFNVGKVCFVTPSVTTPRMASQRGLFTVHHRPDADWTPPELKRNTFTIPSSIAQYFRNKLFSLGIDHAHIMADLDGLCQTLAWQYQAGHTTLSPLG